MIAMLCLRLHGKGIASHNVRSGRRLYNPMVGNCLTSASRPTQRRYPGIIVSAPTRCLDVSRSTNQAMDMIGDARKHALMMPNGSRLLASCVCAHGDRRISAGSRLISDRRRFRRLCA